VALSTPEKCRVSCDTRGHLGPVQVILRGDVDWMRDRNAVHDQRGAAHWYQVDWDESVWIADVVLDSFAETFELQVRLLSNQDWSTVFVARYPAANMTTRNWGKNHEKKGGVLSLWRIHVFGYECTSVRSMFWTSPTLLTEDPTLSP
jgi:hypothetical protein